MDVLFLSRLQFALTIMFHYIFPPLTIGLSLVIVYLLWRHLRTGEAIYDSAARFWTKIFGLNFALGVATGIVMEFQFGTNWAAYSRYVGDVFGSALAAEGIFAFFLESGFLAVLLFGWDRVSPAFHFFSALMVSFGSMFSAVWITVANSWQQTPAGSEIRDHVIGGQVFQRAEITDFWQVVFNPSSVQRLLHVWFGAFILGAFFVMSISAWYRLHGRHREFSERSFSGALAMAVIFSLAQLATGHYQADQVAELQPAKLAAFEGQFETETHASMHLFGWPDEEAGEVRWGLAVPGMLSWLVAFDTGAEVRGLNELEETWGRPPVWISFQSYHLMISIGMLFIASTLYAGWLHRRGTLFETRWLLWFFVGAVVLAMAANQLGWVAAEVGRQPWSVYPVEVDGELVGGLLTADSLSETVEAGEVLGSIIMFGLIYSLLFALWLMVLNNKIQHGPEPVGPEPDRTTVGDYLDVASRMTGKRESMTETKEGARPGEPGGPGRGTGEGTEG